MSDKLMWMPEQKALSPRPRSMACSANSILPIWRAVHAGLRCASVRPLQVASRRAKMAASSRPSAKASQVLTSARSRPPVGISLPTGDKVSKYSTMTRESNTASPPSMIKQGTLPKGLEVWICVWADQTSSVTNW